MRLGETTYSVGDGVAALHESQVVRATPYSFFSWGASRRWIESISAPLMAVRRGPSGTLSSR